MRGGNFVGDITKSEKKYGKIYSVDNFSI